MAKRPRIGGSAYQKLPAAERKEIEDRVWAVVDMKEAVIQEQNRQLREMQLAHEYYKTEASTKEWAMGEIIKRLEKECRRSHSSFFPEPV